MPLLRFCLFILVHLSIVGAQVCRQAPCEYNFEVRHDRTMLYRPKDQPGKAYKVGLNGTKLQVVESVFLRKPNDAIGMVVDDVDEVITADGVSRNILTINGQLPGPSIEVEEGLQIVVRVVNKLRTDGVTIHWHGIYHRDNLWMDGAAQVTQCPIPPFQSFTYRFTATPVGTHWYHAHNGLQRIDGLAGMLIVHPKASTPLPAPTSFNLMVTDWLHEEANVLEVTNPYSQEKGDKGAGEHLHTGIDVREFGVDGVENAGIVFTSGLINGRGRFGGKLLPLTSYDVIRGERYRFRAVNSGGEFAFAISIDEHKLVVVALDGADVKPFQVDDVILAPGETVDFVVQAVAPANSYWIRARTLRNAENDGIIREVLAILRYAGTTSTGDPTSQPQPCTASQPCLSLNCPFKNYHPRFNRRCISIAEMEAVPTGDYDYGLDNDEVTELFLNGAFNWGSSINGRKFSQSTAPLYQKDRRVVNCNSVCADQNLGCVCTGTYSIEVGKTIQLVLSNLEPTGILMAHHPMHLHGHTFAVLKIGYGTYNQSTGRFVGHTDEVVCDTPVCRNPGWNQSALEKPTLNLRNPPVKNTVVVPARGYVVVRFKADSPGTWLYHCHAVTHNVEGMIAMIEEGPGSLPPVPEGFPTCNSFDWTAVEYERYKQSLNGCPASGMTSGGNGMTSGGNGMTPGGNGMTSGDNGMTSGGNGMTPGGNGMTPGDRSNNGYDDSDSITLDKKLLLGLMLGAVALGFLLTIITFLVFYCSQMCKKNKVATKL